MLSPQLKDGMIVDGLWDPYNDVHMGTCADRCAQEHRISRAEQDAHAVESHRRAQQAHEAGFSGRVRTACPLLTPAGWPGYYCEARRIKAADLYRSLLCGH